MDADKQELSEKVVQQEEEINELKLKLTSKDLELAQSELQYDEGELED